MESDCCCGVDLLLWSLLLWSLIVAVESDCCCGVGLLLWSLIVAVEWDCCGLTVGPVKAGAGDVSDAAAVYFFCLLRLSSLALEAHGTV